jgi:hypothetical protein
VGEKFSPISTEGVDMSTDDKYLIAVCAIAAALMLLGVI